MKRALGVTFLLGLAAACGSDPSQPGASGGAGSDAKAGRAGAAGSIAGRASGGRKADSGGGGGTSAGGKGGTSNGGKATGGSNATGGGDIPGAGSGNDSGRANGGSGKGDGGGSDGGEGGILDAAGSDDGGDANVNGGRAGAGGSGGADLGGNTGVGGAVAGGGPTSEPCSVEGATERCCAEGTRTCHAGTWGACDGAFISAESCNGVDDDCNGRTDELGVFSCGVGACAVSVTACVDGALATCTPLEPATQVDGCNGIDDDCDGSVDEDCGTCLHVSPAGDDAAATTSNGVTPFASVQAAIDFAASGASTVKSVCVAAGAACGATFTYGGSADASLTMHDGVDVFGGYEATTWTRCTNSKITLAPQATHGVYFPSSIAARTVLDGFSLNGKGATVEGARQVVLSRIFGDPGTSVTVSDGQAEITGSGVAVAAYQSEVSLIDNCTGSAGQCATDCALNQAGLRSVGLYGSPNSHVEDNGICGGLAVSDDASGVVVRGNQVAGAVSFNPCAGTSPWFVGNRVSTNDQTALSVSGDCRPVIDGNVFGASAATLENGTVTTAQCSPSAGVASGCVFTHNRFGASERLLSRASNSGTMLGLSCSGGSCARVDHNEFDGLSSSVPTGGSRSGTGLRLDGGRVLIDANQFPMSGSSAGVANVGCTGMSVTNAESRIQNNVAGSLCFGRVGVFNPLTRSGGKAQIFSNYFYAAYGATGVDVKDEVKNDILIGSLGGTALAGAFGLPAAVDANAISATSPAKLAAFTIDSGSVQVNTIPDLESLFAGAASGNLGVDCGASNGTLSTGSACIGAGTPAGAPQFDFQGDPRDAEPDIGADEYVP